MKEDIYFPIVLTIDDHVMSPALKLGAFSKPSAKNGREYRLFSVINHKGNDVTRGHYVNYTLDAKNDWIFYDDNKHRKVTEDSVLDSQAYLLFYELI